MESFDSRNTSIGAKESRQPSKKQELNYIGLISMESDQTKFNIPLIEMQMIIKKSLNLEGYYTRLSQLLTETKLCITAGIYQLPDVLDVLKSTDFSRSGLVNIRTNTNTVGENIKLISAALIIFVNGWLDIQMIYHVQLAFNYILKTSQLKGITVSTADDFKLLNNGLKLVGRVISPLMVCDWCLKCCKFLNSTRSVIKSLPRHKKLSNRDILNKICLDNSEFLSLMANSSDRHSLINKVHDPEMSLKKLNIENIADKQEQRRAYIYKLNCKKVAFVGELPQKQILNYLDHQFKYMINEMGLQYQGQIWLNHNPYAYLDGLEARVMGSRTSQMSLNNGASESHPELVKTQKILLSAEETLEEAKKDDKADLLDSKEVCNDFFQINLRDTIMSANKTLARATYRGEKLEQRLSYRLGQSKKPDLSMMASSTSMTESIGYVNVSSMTTLPDGASQSARSQLRSSEMTLKPPSCGTRSRNAIRGSKEFTPARRSDNLLRKSMETKRSVAYKETIQQKLLIEKLCENIDWDKSSSSDNSTASREPTPHILKQAKISGQRRSQQIKLRSGPGQIGPKLKGYIKNQKLLLQQKETPTNNLESQRKKFIKVKLSLLNDLQESQDEKYRRQMGLDKDQKSLSINMAARSIKTAKVDKRKMLNRILTKQTDQIRPYYELNKSHFQAMHSQADFFKSSMDSSDMNTIWTKEVRVPPTASAKTSVKPMTSQSARGPVYKPMAATDCNRMFRRTLNLGFQQKRGVKPQQKLLFA